MSDILLEADHMVKSKSGKVLHFYLAIKDLFKDLLCARNYCTRFFRDIKSCNCPSNAMK